jgi:glucan 1,3-beta-glucosidase
MKRFKAVNLGGWFVLERWMKPSLFEGSVSKARCETSFVTHHPNAKEALEEHWNTWITLEELHWIRQQGIDLVRIPIPWWLFPERFPSEHPYVSPLGHIDRAMDLCQSAGLQVMLDLHTAPGSQNGFDNGGIDGVLSWHHDAKNIDVTIDVLEAIAWRYKDHPALHSLQALNEPHWTIDLAILQSFYRRVYDRLRPILKPQTAIVFHDGFRMKPWKAFFEQAQMNNVLLDVHLYQCFDDKFHSMDATSFLQYPASLVPSLKEMETVIPIVVGEWSLGARDIPYPNGRDAFEQAYANAQIEAYSQVTGWVFWSYKIHDYHSGWNFRGLVERGILKP